MMITPNMTTLSKARLGSFASDAREMSLELDMLDDWPGPDNENAGERGGDDRRFNRAWSGPVSYEAVDIVRHGVW